MSTKQPDAQRWAGILRHQAKFDGPADYKHKAADTLENLHAENEALKAELAAQAQAAAPAQAGEYPPLPDCKYTQSGDIKDFGLYSTAQMLAYVAADRAARGAAQAAPKAPAAAGSMDAQMMALEKQAHLIFNDPPIETSQDVRDVIEWYAASIRKALDSAQAAPADADVQRDAERYRWLREQPDDTNAPRIDVVQWAAADESANEGQGLRMKTLDEAIDAARAAQGGA